MEAQVEAACVFACVRVRSRQRVRRVCVACGAPPLRLHTRTRYAAHKLNTRLDDGGHVHALRLEQADTVDGLQHLAHVLAVGVQALQRRPAAHQLFHHLEVACEG